MSSKVEGSTLISEFFLCASYSTWDKKTDYHLFLSDMTDHGYPMIKKVTVKTKIPAHDDLRPAIVAGLRKKIDGIRAEKQKEINEVEEQIQQLLAIEDFSTREE
jgi:hypothetical protein